MQQLQELDWREHASHLTAFQRAVERHERPALVQWGTFDRGAMERAHRLNGLALPSWLEQKWLDAGSWVCRAVALPFKGRGLKEVARHFGFTEHDLDLDGLLVGQLYSRYRDQGQTFDVEKVRAYNRSDVLAVEHVVRAVQAILDSDDYPVEAPLFPERSSRTRSNQPRRKKPGPRRIHRRLPGETEEERKRRLNREAARRSRDKKRALKADGMEC